MKKLNDVSIRIKILVPITFMVLIMFSYLGGLYERLPSDE